MCNIKRKGLYIPQDIVECDVWYAMWEEDGKICVDYPCYYGQKIYFAVRTGWDDE